MILKRKINEEAEFVQRHIQEFKPASGKVKINKALNAMNDFISNCFEPDGSYKETEYQPTPSPFNCKYCQFSSNKLCPYALS